MANRKYENVYVRNQKIRMKQDRITQKTKKEKNL